MTQDRNISLDILRILACLGVIVIHTAGSPIYHNMVESGTLWYNECLVMDALVRWSVPVFAMLTGFFLLDSRKELTIKKLLTKYVLRVAVALVVWSAFYAFTLHKSIYPFGSQEGHFWYLGMVIGLYLSLPILRMIAANKTILSYFCWVWLFFMCYRFIGNFCILPFALDNVLFVNYAGYALWGVYCKDLLQKVNKWIIAAIAGGGDFYNNIRCIVDTKWRFFLFLVRLTKCHSNFHRTVLSIFYLPMGHTAMDAKGNMHYLGMHLWNLSHSSVDSDTGVFPRVSLCGATYITHADMRGYDLCGRTRANLFVEENTIR